MKKLDVRMWIVYLGLFAAFVVTAVNVLGTAVNYPVQYVGDHDSVRVWIWKDGVIIADTTTATGLDSIGYSSFPITDTLVLDDGSDYVIKSWFYSDGSSTPRLGEIVLRYTGGTVPGAGPYTISILTVDTLSGVAVDTIVEGVVVTVTNLSTGMKVDSKTSLATGFTYWNLGATSYEIKGKKTRYAWAYDTVTYSADSTDTLEGYNVSISAGTGASTCNVYGTAINIDGAAAAFARVVFSLKGEAVDTCNDIVIANFSIKVDADINGLFEQELIYSSCLGGKKYSVIIYHLDGSSKEFTITVPNAATYEVTGQ